MRLFWNRPLALAGCLFALTSVLIWDCPIWSKHLLIVLSAVLFVLLVLFRIIRGAFGRYGLLAALCIASILLSSTSSCLFFNLRYADLQKKVGTSCAVEGVVLKRMSYGEATSAMMVRITSLDGEDCDFDAMVEMEEMSTLGVGERFRMTATPRDFRHEDGIDEEQLRLADGVLFIFTSSTEDEVARTGEDRSIEVLASKWNMRLAYRLKNEVGGEAGALCAAFLLGNREWLSDDTALHFQRSGVSHLLALSGLHLSIVIGFLELVFRRLRLSGTLRAVLILLSGLLFLTLTGFAVSTCRAFLLMLFLYLAYLFRERYDSFTALSVALVLILLVTPYAVLDVALWMSFLSAASIIVFLPAVSSAFQGLRGKRGMSGWLRRILAGVVKALLLGYFATIALLLLSALEFGTISIASIPTTLFLSFPVTLLLVGSLLLLLFPFLTPIASLLSLLGDLILDVVRNVSEIENILLPVGDILTQTVLAALTSLVVLLAVIRLVRMRWLALPLVAVFLAIGVSLSVTHLTAADVWSLQTLQSDTGDLRLYSKQGESVLICDTHTASVSAYEIRDAAVQARCTEIDNLVICQYDDQSVVFLIRLSNAVKIRDLHLPLPEDRTAEGVALRLREEATLRGIEIHFDAPRWIEAYR